MQRAAAPFVSIDVEIDAFMAHGPLALQLQAARDLFRAPLLMKQEFHLLPSLRRDARTVTLKLPAAGQLLGSVWVITTRSAVPSQLTRDRALVATDEGGYLSFVLAGFHQHVYLVSLFTGKLSVAHWRASLTWWLEKHATLLQLALNHQSQSCT